MRKISIFSLLFFISAPGFLPPAFGFTLSDFESPESMVVDPGDGSYYVSNMNGGAADKDGNGYISKIASSGNLVIQKFIGEKKDELPLHAPKGLALVGQNIFVADIDTVKGFNKKTRKPSVLVDLSPFGAKFLNDLAADASGALYVSDTMTHQIFRIDPAHNYKVTVLKESEKLGGPNGLLVNPKNRNLLVVTWQPGQILEIDRAGRVHVLKRGLSGLDGIDYDNEGNLYVSDYERGHIYKIALFGRGLLSTYLSGLTTPADISYDRRRDELLIPSSKGNKVLTFKK